MGAVGAQWTPAVTSCPAPWFGREARLGRRVIWQWRPEVRFGPTVTTALRGRVMVNGVEFPDEAAAARFDLDGVAIYAAGGGTGRLREFADWEQAEAWLREDRPMPRRAQRSSAPGACDECLVPCQS